MATMTTFVTFIFLSMIIGKFGGALKPLVTFTPNWGNVIVYDDVTLTCDVPSTVREEPQNYTWYKDNQPIPGHQQRLHIESSRVDDSGDYQCRTNASDISDPVFLNVTDAYVILQRAPTAIYEGDSLTLRCHTVTFLAFSTFDVRFSKDNEEIISEFPDSELRIDKVSQSTAGHYQCSKFLTGYDNDRYENSEELSISVKELFSPPEIKVTPHWKIEGSVITIRCDTTLDPRRADTELLFAFYRDGRTVRGFNVSDTYRVRSAQLEDSGKYTCDVKTMNDTVRKTSDGFYIQIHGGAIRPVVTFTPNWGNVMVYDDVTLLCDVPSTVREEPQNYTWYKDHRPIPGHQQSLHIESSIVDDSGDYQCRTNASDISDPVFLNVTDVYVILQRPPTAIYEGDSLTLRCHTATFLAFSTFDVRFYKDNEEIISQFPDSELRIDKVFPTTAGHYQCSKFLTGYGNDRYENSEELSISVKELFSPPEIKVTPYRKIEGSNITMRCDTTLDPHRAGTELLFAFYKDGRTVQEFNVSDTYRVQSAQLEDSGKYTCVVRTMNDTVRKTSNGFYIKIHDYTV